MKKILKRIVNKLPYIAKLIRRVDSLTKQLEQVKQEFEQVKQEFEQVKQEFEKKQIELEKYTSYNLNIDLFRSETKSQDEREFQKATFDFLVKVKPNVNYPETIIEIIRQKKYFSEVLLYGHLGLAKLVSGYEFETILDIGSRNGTASKVFDFLDKKVTTIEFSSDFESDYSGDYLDINFSKQFDAIWCSHVLEHQRNIGLFLEKIFHDLKENGVLALTVPLSLSPLIIGHPNIFTPLHLIYQLILAGFDCKDAKLKCYDWQFTIILNKKSNEVKPISFASTHFSDISPDGMGFVPNLLNFFPVSIDQNGHCWGEIDDINWD